MSLKLATMIAIVCVAISLGLRLPLEVHHGIMHMPGYFLQEIGYWALHAGLLVFLIALYGKQKARGG